MKNNTTYHKMTQADFWNLPAVQEQQEIQKRHPYGSTEHKAADKALHGLLVKHVGMTAEEAQEYLGEY